MTLPGKYGIVFPKVNNGFSASRAVRVRGENRESGANPERYRHCQRGGARRRRKPVIGLIREDAAGIADA